MKEEKDFSWARDINDLALVREIILNHFLDASSECQNALTPSVIGIDIGRGDSVSAYYAIPSNDVELPQTCRNCVYRNKDFDVEVKIGHETDLRCAINPIYAENSVGECLDFVSC